MPVFSNPVISGFHPDPSLCRVDGDYYLVVSSFAYLPGIPIFHSTNLTDWEQIGHVFDRAGMIDLAGLHVSDGLWAPTIRYHNGLFYVVTTIARNKQGAVTLLTTSADPAGSWSDPVVLDAEGIDPSLFFDDDGRCWYTGCRDSAQPDLTGPGELFMRELDLDSLQLVGPTHILWHGAMRGAWVEAPHLYRREGSYYLVAAEGGTEGNHSVTVARAEAITGPYIGDPRNPVLTHRHLGSSSLIHNVGHADLVDTALGDTWAVVLGTRPVNGFHVLGREVFLVPVRWTAQGPYFAPGIGKVRGVEEAPRTIGGSREVADTTPSGAPVNPPQWISLRELPPRMGPFAEVALPLRPDTLAGTGQPAFVGVRQAHPEFVSSLVVDFAPNADGEEAGFALHQGATGHATITVQQREGFRIIVCTVVADGGTATSQSARAPEGPIRITITAVGLDYLVEFSAATQPQADTLSLVDGRYLSTERAGGFVGVVLGPYATSNGRVSTAVAHFSEFTYVPRSHGEARADVSVAANAPGDYPAMLAIVP